MTNIHPSTRSFPRTCLKCRAKSVNQASVQRVCEIKYDGKLLALNISDLPVEQCSACGNVTLGAESEARIDDALRAELGLLTPVQIRACRKELNLTQPELAAAIGCATETVCRWETGDTIQSRSYDRFLRAYFHLPQLRELFANAVLSVGSQVTCSTGEQLMGIGSPYRAYIGSFGQRTLRSGLVNPNVDVNTPDTVIDSASGLGKRSYAVAA